MLDLPVRALLLLHQDLVLGGFEARGFDVSCCGFGSQAREDETSRKSGRGSEPYEIQLHEAVDQSVRQLQKGSNVLADD